MRNRYLYILSVIIFLANSCSSPEQDLNKSIERGLKVAKTQSIHMAEYFESKPDSLPKTFEGNHIVASNSHWWCSGFFPGTLWLLYEADSDEKLKQLAIEFSNRVEDQKFTTDNHDVGFILMSSFGNGYRETQEERYKEILATGAQSLSTRFNTTTGTIRSWDHTNNNMWQYPVIIDNMMNLELLTKVARQTGDSALFNIAVTHADKTIENHFRPDGSSFHVVSYDTVSGLPHLKQTWQGFGDESAWSRGQAWALYGYTMMYRETKLERYLEQAKKIAHFILNNPNLPKDKIPYWDFDDTKIPDSQRDASAAAIIASALIELSGFVEGGLADEYMQVAKTQIVELSSPKYLAEPGTNGNFILKHAVGHLPRNSEVDVPLTYADYYYVEALTRMKNKLSSKNNLASK